MAWEAVLAHRPAEVRGAVRDRFVDHKLTPDQVRAVLEDGGDSLQAAANSGDEDWADRFGGLLAVALLAAEVSALAAHLNTRGSAVRALAVDALLDEFSAVTVAAHTWGCRGRRSTTSADRPGSAPTSAVSPGGGHERHQRARRPARPGHPPARAPARPAAGARPFAISWLVGALTSPPVAALAAVIIWFASHNYLGPPIAGAAILGFGQLASRVYQRHEPAAAMLVAGATVGIWKLRS